MLKIVFLDLLSKIVDLHGGYERWQREDGGAITHSAGVVKGTLRVHEKHYYLLKIYKILRFSFSIGTF